MKSRLFIISIFICFSTHFFAQDKKIDRLEMLYDQGNYKIVMRKSDRLLRNENYKSHPSPILFKALSEYQLSKSNDRFSSSDAVYDYEQFLKLDSIFYYQKAYSNYIYDMQLGIANEIRDLNEKGEVEKAKIKYDSFVRLFGNVAKFDELIITEIKVTPTENLTPEVPLTTSKIREGVINEAKKHIGTPYKYGGISTEGFDCSGFTQYVFSKNGKQLPRTASTQASTYKEIKLSKVQPGDLLFFGKSRNNISHVGIVISNGDKEPLTMIHASTSRGIMISNVDADSYWKPKLQFAATVLEP